MLRRPLLLRLTASLIGCLLIGGLPLVARAQGSTLPALSHSVAPTDSLLAPETIAPSSLERIDSLAKASIALGAYPGCQLFALYRGEVIYDKAFGLLMPARDGHRQHVATTSLYDLASITKAAATTPALMLLVAEKLIRLDAPLLTYLPETRESLLGMVTIRQLLLHQSGLPAGINFYTDLIDDTSYEGSLIRSKAFDGGVKLVGRAWGNPNFRFKEDYVADKPTKTHTLPFGHRRYLAPSFRERMMERLLAARVSASKGYRYSDLNFLLLQAVIERVTGEPLDHFVEERLYKPLGARLYFNPLDKGVKIDRIAPAQHDLFLRGEILRGRVDDEAAACLGGVAGNAGLFGSAEELAKVGQLLLQRGAWGRKQLIPSETVRLFLETTGINDFRALGFDKPRSSGGPTGQYASPATFGHQGFTGTCFWVDPTYELVFIFLSNRTYPSRQNTLINQERLRQRFQDLIYEAIGVHTPR